MNLNKHLPTDRILEKLDAYLRKNDYDAAKKHLLYWLSEAQTVGDQKGILLLNNELVGLCRKLGEKDQAISFAQTALQQIETMQIQQNVGAATTYLNCATVYKAFEMAEQSIPLFEKAKVIYETNLSPEDDRLGGLYNNMALALVDLHRFKEANALYQKALTIMESIPGKEPEQAITYLNMATAAEMQLGLEDADKLICSYLEKAMALLDRHKGLQDGNYAFVCEKCAPVFGYYGYFAYQAELEERCRRIYEGA